MPDSVKARTASVADVETMFELRCSVRENPMSRDQLAELGITPESVGAMLASEAYASSIIEADGIVVAFSIAEVRSGYVFALFTRTGHEGRGYGKAALGFVEAVLRQRQVATAWLTTGPRPSDRSHGFYKHLGWSPAGIENDGQIRYSKQLS